jgi:hypothetical protein
MFSIAWLSVPLVVLSFGERRRHQRRVRYRAYRRIWPAAGRAWHEAMVCLRCHIAFFPAGTVDDVPAARQPIPMANFGSAVLAIGAQLTDHADVRDGTVIADQTSLVRPPEETDPSTARGKALPADAKVRLRRPTPPDP